MNKMIIKTSDNIIFNIDFKIIKQSEFFLEKIEIGENKIKLLKINSHTMEKIMSFLVYHSEIENTDQWDKQFIEKFSGDELIDILWASNFLKINDLVKLGKTYLLSLMENDNINEIRNKLNVKSNLTEDDENEINNNLNWEEIKN